MKSLWKLWITAALAALLLTACGQDSTEPAVLDEEVESPDTEQTEAAFPVTVTDAIGNDITLEEAPDAIVSMMPSNTEILFALGLGEEVKAVTDFDNYPPEAAEKEKIGGMEFNVEKIVSLSPDVVFAHESALSTGEAGFQQIRDAGINVFIVDNAVDFETTYATIEDMGKLTGKTEEAEKIVSDMKAKVEEVQGKVADVEPKTVLVETSPRPEIYSPAGNTFMDEMLKMVKAENVVGDLEGWVKVDPEEIVNRNPDVILTTYGGYVEDPLTEVTERDGFDSVTAVKNGAIVDLDADLTNRQAPRLADGLEAIAKAIYPEVFGE